MKKRFGHIEKAIISSCFQTIKLDEFLTKNNYRFFGYGGGYRDKYKGKIKRTLFVSKGKTYQIVETANNGCIDLKEVRYLMVTSKKKIYSPSFSRAVRSLIRKGLLKESNIFPCRRKIRFVRLNGRKLNKMKDDFLGLIIHDI